MLYRTAEATEIRAEPVHIELKAGEISLHSDLLLHGSPPNNSNRRRCGLTMRYASTDVIAHKGWNRNSILCCGVSPKLKSFRCAARMVSHKLYGHRWHKAYSRGNTVRAPNRRTTRARPTKGWAACSIARGSHNRCWKQYRK